MVRESVVDGMFYEADKSQLIKQIENSFLSKFGPGELPDKSKNKKILGIVSPHAGYVFSAPAAAWSFKALAESGKIDTIIVLAPNHTGMGRTSLLTQNYKTPLGEIETDQDLAKKIFSKVSVLVDDMNAHSQEHSLEVQIPFIQYLFNNNVKILPIVVSSPHPIKELAKGIKEAIDESDKSIAIVTSSDFTHYGPNYHYVKFQTDIEENIKKMDMEAISYIKNFDSEGFLNYCNDNNMSICGYLPIAVMIDVLKEKAKKVEVLKYYLSSDVIPDNENSVSYASIVIE